MTGIFLLFVIGIWLFLITKISLAIKGKLPKVWWRPVVSILVFAILLPLPVIDEIIGGQQFAQLCKENSNINIDRATAIGKTVYLDNMPEIQLKGTAVPITLQRWIYIDVITKIPIVSYNTLDAKGGLFIRILGISEGDAPLTFKSFCSPKGRPASIQTFKEFGINYIQPPSK